MLRNYSVYSRSCEKRGPATLPGFRQLFSEGLSEIWRSFYQLDASSLISYYGYIASEAEKMRQIPATTAKDQFGQILARVQTEPVEITKRGKIVAIMLSPSQYQNMGGDRARLRAVIKDIQAQARANGLTPEILSELLNEEE